MIKLVLVRHGQSQWNLENRFTGWTDVELSEKGINEAKEAGRVLKEKGFEIMDRITLYYSGDEDINKCFDTYKELIASETLATEVKKEVKGEEVDINSHKVTLDVEKN